MWKLFSFPSKPSCELGTQAFLGWQARETACQVMGPQPSPREKQVQCWRLALRCLTLSLNARGHTSEQTTGGTVARR